MKKALNILLATAMVAGMAACSDGGGNKKFQPKDRTTSTMSDEDRQAAIARKKAELSVDPYAMMHTNDVKLSVMPPVPAGDITEDMTERIAVKMLEVISANGIGGLNTVPGFALAATITPGEKTTTGTAPQKMVTNYTINYQVINVTTGDVYATATQELTGVGSSFEHATRLAVRSIKNTPALQQMLATASDKIIAWFNDNLDTFKSQVDAAYGREDYALALALIESVPQKATAAFEYAQGRHEDILAKFQTKVAADELTALKQAIQSADGAMSTDVYAHLAMLPKGSAEYKEAMAMVSNYEDNVKTRREETEKREIAAAEAQAEREQQIKMAEIESDRLKAKYQAVASTQAMRQHLREKDDKERGFWGNLGARIIGAIDKHSDDAANQDDFSDGK